MSAVQMLQAARDAGIRLHVAGGDLVLDESVRAGMPGRRKIGSPSMTSGRASPSWMPGCRAPRPKPAPILLHRRMAEPRRCALAARPSPRL